MNAFLSQTNLSGGPLILACDRVLLRTPDVSMAPRLRDYLIANRDRFAPVGPRLEEEPTLESAQRSIADALLQQDRGDGIRFYLFERDASDMIIGNISLSNIVMGAFRACHLGYRIDVRHEGKGTMFEALSCALKYAFEEKGLHRVMANYMPTNERSGALLRRLGFVVEGYARDYLHLDGAWRDHVLTSLVRAEPRGP